MVSQENIDQQHESKGYWLIIGGIAFVFLVLTWYALTKVAVRVQYVRDNMRQRIKPVLFLGFLCIIIFFFILFLINRWGKKEQRDDKKGNNETEKK